VFVNVGFVPKVGIKVHALSTLVRA